MGNIVLLDDLTINKIAAGEVVERPASVVKEMMENSIDAGATSISVEIKNGGISYIRITDNGKGISPDDMELAFERHATSKIRQASDLEEVKSMGFRGEALASIAAIANVEMVSRTENSEIGRRIVVEAGNIIEKEEIGCPVGTTITVKNLFFNTPVRYKFLKKDYTESGYVEDAVTRIALVNTKVAVKFINTGKTIIQTPGNGDAKAVIYSIYGKDIAEGIVDVDYEYEGIRINGVVGKPEIARSNRSNQVFFVNKRYVKDKTLSAATEQAFKGLLPIGRFGFVILNLEVNPAKVDVNVHPAKLEVRFEEENKIFKAVFHAIKDSLLKTELISNVAKEPEKKVVDVPIGELKEQTMLQETKSPVVGLFRKISTDNVNATEPQAVASNNVIEDLYKKKEFGVDTTSIPNKENFAEMKRESPEDKNNQFIKQLMDMQKKIKEEATRDNLTINEANLNLLSNQEETFLKQEPEQTQVVANGFEEMNRVKEQFKPEQEMEMSPEIKMEIPQEEVVTQTVNEVFSGETLIQTNELGSIYSVNLEETKENEQESGKIATVTEEVAKPQNGLFDEMYEKLFGKLPHSKIKELEEQQEKVESAEFYPTEMKKDDNVTVFEEVEDYQQIPSYRIIGVAFKTYIILEMDQELYIIDQHAAHERVLYEKVKANYYSDEVKESQLMLLPDIITLTHKEMDIARENMKMFEKAGFILEEFGENTLKLTGVPNICVDLETKELFLDILDEIDTVARTARQEVEERFIATVACKAAVKANMSLSNEEIDNLIGEMLKLPNPFTCPHGRPTAIKMSKYEIEKKFSRRK